MHTNGIVRDRARRSTGAVLALLLALTGALALAAPSPVGAQEAEPATGLLWKMSEGAFTSSSLSPAHATAAPATKTTDGFSFPEATSASYNPLTGAGEATFPGSFDLGNTNQGNYRIRVADPKVVIAAGGLDGRVDASVSYALWDAASSAHVWSTPVVATVADLTLAAGAITDTGNHISFTTTPDFVLRTDLAENPNSWRQFPQPYLDAIAPAVPSLLGHFRQTGAGSDANKAPSPITIGFDYEAPVGPAGLTWKMSNGAFTSSSLAPAHTTAAPATKTADGFNFPETTSAIYDPESGEGEISFPGSYDLGNTNQGNYRIRVADPVLSLPGDGTGTLDATVTYALWDAASSTHVWSTPTIATVAALTFPEGSINVDGGNLSFTVVPDFVLRTDLAENPNGWKQFPQPYLDAIAPAVPSLLGHFRQTGAGSDANKAPTALAVNVPFELPELPVGLTWKMSNGAFTSSSLSPAHATAAPATKTDDGFNFPETTTALYDPETGEGEIAFPGSYDLGNTNQGNYRIRVADPVLTLAGDGTGTLDANVSYALWDAASSTHVWSTPVLATVADLVFPEGSITVEGENLSFTVVPEFVLRTDLAENPNGWKQFPQPYLDAIAPAVPSLLGHFRQTGAGSDANKAPSPLIVNVPFEVPVPPDPDSVFVHRVYERSLLRAGSESEVEYWTGRLDAGVSRTSVALSIAGAPEGRGVLVRQWYQSALGRNPSAADRTYWVGELATNLTPETFVTHIVGSNESFVRSGGTNAGLAGALYTQFLGTTGDSAGVAYWEGRFAATNAGPGRRNVIKTFGASPAVPVRQAKAAATVACGSLPALTSEQDLALRTQAVSPRHNTPRLVGFAVATVCPEADVTA